MLRGVETPILSASRSCPKKAGGCLYIVILKLPSHPKLANASAQALASLSMWWMWTFQSPSSSILILLTKALPPVLPLAFFVKSWSTAKESTWRSICHWPNVRAILSPSRTPTVPLRRSSKLQDASQNHLSTLHCSPSTGPHTLRPPRRTLRPPSAFKRTQPLGGCIQ